jgi:hypothetical protein
MGRPLPAERELAHAEIVEVTWSPAGAGESRPG